MGLGVTEESSGPTNKRCWRILSTSSQCIICEMVLFKASHNWQIIFKVLYEEYKHLQQHVGYTPRNHSNQTERFINRTVMQIFWFDCVRLLNFEPNPALTCHIA